MRYENLLYKTAGGVATITINRPQVLNSLNQATIGELTSVLKEAGDDPGVRVVILTGAGEKAFIGGADVKEMHDRVKDGSLASTSVSFRSSLIEPFLNLGKPVIAAVNGYCLGGGMEILYACILAYAAEGARFAQPEVNLGFNPLAGATQQLPLLVGKKKAMEILLLGEMFDAARALRLGIINEVVPASTLMERAQEIATRLASKPRLALRYIIDCVWQAGYLTLEQGLDMEAKCYSLCCTSPDVIRGLEAFLEKRRKRQ
ncbi:MAG: enoyl-CoA hydratase/isomerase family protein [Desulfobaccales bacterium]|jgi:enoyl-CoA hydratase